jgi:diguanylate cyclase (GGDEF)-like protein/PAS domain S-box-containing protein
LSDDAWRRRHRSIVAILWAHILAIPLFAVEQGHGLTHGIEEVGAIALCAAVASVLRDGRRRRVASLASVLGLLLSSAVLVHLSGGMIEMHFHFFVMVGVITLYQDWTTFVASIVFVATHHAVVGTLAPRDVFSHGAAWNHPLKWAVIHAVFVLCASAAQLASWRFVEDEYERSEREITDRERRFRALIENSSDGISVIGLDGSIVYDSPSVATMLGFPSAERQGRDAFGFIHPDDVARSAVVFEELLVGGHGTNATIELRARHCDGTWRWLDAHIVNLVDQAEVGGLVANFRDVTDRKLLEDRLAHQAFHDSLTGLANRALFGDRVEHALTTSARHGGGVAVIFIDLDDFKTINDGLGHDAGDAVLQVVAGRLTSELRASDTCARLGGDEFAVLVEGIDEPGDAYTLGARLLVALAEPADFEGSAVALNASMGIVVAEPADDAAALLRNADLAMYRAKAGGKGRYEIFEYGMYDAVKERLTLKADLIRAVAASEFVAVYQPIVDLRTGMVVGAEALARWEHPDHGRLLPASFIDLAEETGVIVEIGRQMLDQACHAAATWRVVAGRPISVSVNLSPRQLQHPDIARDVERALARSGLDPAGLTLEITEGVLIDDPDAALAALQELKALGVELALDDFGTGYSSLSYLRHFPVDRLKIDKSFVDALGDHGAAGDASLVGAIAGLGDVLRLETIAEGIERSEQVAHLLSLGCHLGQGFHFARPVAAVELDHLLVTGVSIDSLVAPAA